MEPAKRKAGRPPAEKDPEELGPTLKLSLDADRLLTAQAKKLKMSKRQYASAAVTFMATAGLDPRKELPADLAMVSQKVEAGVSNVRSHNADIGNRLYALTRGFEKTLYQFMQQQQHATYAYIEAVEGNMLRYLVSLETSLLGPMIELIIKAKFDAYAARIVSERAYLEILKKPDTEWKPMHDKLSGERDQLAVAEIREFLKDHKALTPRPSIKPSATPVPAKPVASTTTSPPSTP